MIIKDLKINDLNENILDSFNRYQEIKKAWCFDEENLKIYKTDEKYDWDDLMKVQIIKSLKDIIRGNGFVIGIFDDNKLIGFVSVAGEVFGLENQYRELKYIHVSNEYRGQGLGKELFELMVIKLKDSGIQKIYMSANPSEESQMFYKRRGCTRAVEIKKSCVEEEPYDCQIEYVL